MSPQSCPAALVENREKGNETDVFVSQKSSFKVDQNLTLIVSRKIVNLEVC